MVQLSHDAVQVPYFEANILDLIENYDQQGILTPDTDSEYYHSTTNVTPNIDLPDLKSIKSACKT